jgi:hypothetical protein
VSLVSRHEKRQGADGRLGAPLKPEELLIIIALFVFIAARLSIILRLLVTP